MHGVRIGWDSRIRGGIVGWRDIGRMLGSWGDDAMGTKGGVVVLYPVGGHWDLVWM